MNNIHYLYNFFHDENIKIYYFGGSLSIYEYERYILGVDVEWTVSQLLKIIPGVPMR